MKAYREERKFIEQMMVYILKPVPRTEVEFMKQVPPEGMYIQYTPEINTADVSVICRFIIVLIN